MTINLQQSRSDYSAAMTFDEVSMERSKSFVKALQELKNLRPQLYSAAEYCEKSYLNSEQKQMVLNNLKDYTVRALVNAVDHLGTVAYKLTDVLEQQTVDISAMELNFSSLNHQLLTCQTYVNKEGLRQQQLLAIIPRHHKHYILPSKSELLINSMEVLVVSLISITFVLFVLFLVSFMGLHSKLDTVNKKVHFSPHIQINARQNQAQARVRLQPSATPTAKTLSWHLASETKSTLKGSSSASMSMGDPKSSGKNSEIFHLSESEESTLSKPFATHLQLRSGSPASSAVKQAYDVTRKNYSEGSKPMTGFRSFDNPTRQEIVRTPVRSKSMLSSFVKQKTQKLKASAVF